MQAIVSGQAGLAVLIDGDSVYSIEANEPGTSTPRDRADLLHLFSGATDVTEFPVDDRAAAVTRLQFDWNCDRALRMTLILLDPEEDSETRVLAAECVEDRLSIDPVKNWLLARLYQAPMPSSGDLPGAVELTAGGDLPLIQKRLAELQADQSHIAAAVESWADVNVPTGGNSLDKPQLFDRLIAAGACYRIARAAAIGKPTSATFELIGHPRLKTLPGIGPVISSWIGILGRQSKEVADEKPIAGKTAAKHATEKKARSHHDVQVEFTYGAVDANPGQVHVDTQIAQADCADEQTTELKKRALTGKVAQKGVTMTKKKATKQKGTKKKATKKKATKKKTSRGNPFGIAGSKRKGLKKYGLKKKATRKKTRKKKAVENI